MTHSSEPNKPSSSFIDAPVVDASGNHASIVSLHRDEPGEAQVLVRLQQGGEVLLPLSLLASQEDGSYRLPFSFQVHDGQQAQSGLELRFPVLAEELSIGKRVVDTGAGVRIHKSVDQREEVVDQPLQRDELLIEHVPIGRAIAEGEVPQTRYEGDTLVVPVVEEVLVVRKQLLLKEEVRVTRRQQEYRAPQTVVLRTEQIKVERFD